jgi:uncharacterized protein
MYPDIVKIPLRHMASGDVIYLQVYKFIGSIPGKKVYIQSNLHGAEIAGNAVIHQLMEYLITLNANDLEGEIWLVPVCNPMGTNQRSHNFSTGRYDSYEHKDWNRIFWDYEKEAVDLLDFAKSQINFQPDIVRLNYLSLIKEKFAQISDKINNQSSVSYTYRFSYQLQSLSLDCDYLIDLHTSTNEGLNYLYYFRNRELSAKYFLLDFGILLDEYDGNAFDEAFIKPWLALESCFEKLGKNIKFDVEAWTLELGTGMKIKADSVEKGVRGIKNYLKHKGVLNIPDIAPLSAEMTFKDRTKAVMYYAPMGGMIQRRMELGTEVKSGDKLYQILSFNKEGKLPRVIDIYASADGLVYDTSINEAVNQGEFVLGVI